jgi:hypothetical protein
MEHFSKQLENSAHMRRSLHLCASVLLGGGIQHCRHERAQLQGRAAVSQSRKHGAAAKRVEHRTSALSAGGTAGRTVAEVAEVAVAVGRSTMGAVSLCVSVSSSSAVSVL